MAQSGKEIHHDERYTDIHNRDNSYNCYRYNDCSRNRCEDRKRRRKSIITKTISKVRYEYEAS